MQTGKAAIQTGTLRCSALAPAVGADVPVCVPAGSCTLQICLFPKPICSPWQGFLQTMSAGYGRLGMAIVRFVHQTAESKGLTWLSHPKHHTATSPSLSLLPLLYCHSCTETMLWVSGTKPCPICKIVTPKQRGGGSTDKTHSSI